jgi:hypothetical protein
LQEHILPFVTIVKVENTASQSLLPASTLVSIVWLDFFQAAVDHFIVMYVCLDLYPLHHSRQNVNLVSVESFNRLLRHKIVTNHATGILWAKTMQQLICHVPLESMGVQMETKMDAHSVQLVNFKKMRER